MLRAESLRVRPDGSWIKDPLEVREATDRFGERLWCLPCKEDPRGRSGTRRIAFQIDDGFTDPPSPKGDDGPPRGLRFHGYEPEILLGGKHQGAAASVEIRQRIV